MKAETYPFVVRPLPCEYREPSPYISAETLLYHHDRIYKNDIDLLNQALSDYPVLQKRSLRELLAAPENLPVSLQIPVRFSILIYVLFGIEISRTLGIGRPK